MSVFHLDFETFSTADLKSFGAFRYASDPSTEILLCAIAKGEDRPRLWVHPLYREVIPGDNYRALQWVNEAIMEDDSLIYAHNAQFEAAVSKYCWGNHFDGFPALNKWRCTAAMARRAAIPSSLDKAAEFLNLPMKKDARGKTLIRKFSILQTSGKRKGERILPQEEPEAFREFGEYCIQDVETERALHKRLAAFELKGDILAGFQFDQRMNERGIPVNVPALQKTHKLVSEFTEGRAKEFRGITGLEHTQRDKVQAWLIERGYPAKNLKSATVEKVLANGPESYGMEPEAFRALQLRNEIAFAAVKKVPSMLGAACSDGRVRGAVLWSGAERTHRSAGRIIQPQNFRKPTVPDTKLAYKLLCRGTDPEALEALFGPTLETVASCIRHFIHWPQGIFDADYSAIEARVNPWLCGAEEKLEHFRRGEPIYEQMGSKIFGVPVESIGKNSLERFVGKQAELGCGYQMGADKFKGTCSSYGQDIPIELAVKAVNAWRASNPEIVGAWASIGQAAMNAIRNPGKIFKATARIAFGMTNKAGFPALVMSLPSGHRLIYPKARIQRVWKEYQGREYEADEIQFWGKPPGKQVWGWVSTFGGKLLENATQATAGDILTHGMIVAESRGFQIFMPVHDQCLAFGDPSLTVEGYCQALCTLPGWAEGLPVEAEGQLVEFYQK
jgi:DNA polymerase